MLNQEMRVFQSGNHEILIVNVLAISSEGFNELGKTLLTLFCLYASKQYSCNTTVYFPY